MSSWAETWDSDLRWVVKSQSSYKRYIVDLGEWECQCKRARVGEQQDEVIVVDGVSKHLYKSHAQLHADGRPRLSKELTCFHKTVALRAFFNEIVLPKIENTPVLREFLKSELSGHQDALALAFVDHMHAEEKAQEIKPDTGVAGRSGSTE